MGFGTIDLRHRAAAPLNPLSMVYGGGGAVGIAWHLAVNEALHHFGFDVSQAPCVGTSAGSWACGAARLGIGIEAFDEIGSVQVPDRTPGALRALAERIVGDVRIDNAWISAVSLPSMQRRLFDASQHDLADLVAASSAVPALFSPHTIQGRQYVDGGVRSMASIDAAPRAELLIASLPIAGPLFGPIGRALERTSRRALAKWRHHTGGTTLVLRPGKSFVAAVGNKPHALMDVELAKKVYPVAFDTACRRLDHRLRHLHLHHTHTAVAAH